MLGTVVPYGGSFRVIPHPLSKGPFFNPSELAQALHCLQDSFSPGHVRRENGIILDIFDYGMQDKKAHKHDDIVSGTIFSDRNRQDAVQASADLVELALRAALSDDITLSQWDNFAAKWFKAGALDTKRAIPKTVPPELRPQMWL